MIGLPPGFSLPPGVTLPPGTNVLGLSTVGNNEALSGTGAGTTGTFQQAGITDNLKNYIYAAELLSPFGPALAGSFFNNLLGIGEGQKGPPNGLYLILGVGLILLGGLALALTVVEISLPRPQVEVGPAKVSLQKPSKRK